MTAGELHGKIMSEVYHKLFFMAIFLILFDIYFSSMWREVKGIHISAELDVNERSDK